MNFYRFLRKTFFIVILVSGIFHYSFGDTNDGIISGKIRDAVNNDPIPGVTIQLLSGFGGTSTDVNGNFKLKNLPKGIYSIRVSSIGYESRVLENIYLIEKLSADLEISLKPKAVELKSVTVTPGRFSIMGSQAATQQTLTQKEIQTMPQLGDDFFRAVSRLPGMSSNDFSTRFSVRGGEYEEVLVTIDGLQIYEPFHLKDIDGGAMSIIDVATVESIDLMTGGFPAEYGDKMSGAFNITSRQVPPDKSRFSAGLSLVSARVSGEGRFGGNKGSWLVSARRGYIDYVLKLVGEDNTIKPTYYDIFSKAQYQLSENYSLSMHLLLAQDDLKAIGEEEDKGDTLHTKYGNSYFWASLWSEPKSGLIGRTVLSTGQVNHDRFGYDIEKYGRPELDYLANDEEKFSFTGIKTDWEYELADFLILKSGLEYKKLWADFTYYSRDFNYDEVQTQDSIIYLLTGIDTTSVFSENSGHKYNGYLSGKFRLSESLVSELGARYDYTSYTKDKDISPRANIAYNYGEKLTVRLGWGLYYQTDGIEELRASDGVTDYNESEKAECKVGGIEYDFENGIRARLEAYDKQYSNLKPSFRNTFEGIEAFPEAESDRAIINRNNGRSKGIELYLKKENGEKFSWWGSYALSKVTENINYIYFPDEDIIAYQDIELPRPRDQRHTIYYDVHYRPNTRWQLSGAFQFHSGWPYTNVYMDSVVAPEGTSYWLKAGKPWGSKLDPYHRLDVRINRYFPLSRGKITAFIEILNVLNRKNVRSYDHWVRVYNNRVILERKPDNWFGIMPSFGISYSLEF